MTYRIDIQNVCNEKLIVKPKTLKSWIKLTLQTYIKTAALTLRIVNIDEIVFLNTYYRNKNKPTNVLAFPSQIPEEIKEHYPLLGDVVICPAVLYKESLDQKIPIKVHWAHIVIHGVLHLLGFDHIQDADAAIMQRQEQHLLRIVVDTLS